jgi:hypothetical protein
MAFARLPSKFKLGSPVSIIRKRDTKCYSIWLFRVHCTSDALYWLLIYRLSQKQLHTKSTNKSTNSVAFCPKAKYRPSGCRLSAKLVPTSGEEGVAWSVHRVPTAVNLGFTERSRYFPLKQLLNYPHEAEWAPFQAHYFSDNLVAPGPLDPYSGILTTRPQRRSTDKNTVDGNTCLPSTARRIQASRHF